MMMEETKQTKRKGKKRIRKSNRDQKIWSTTSQGAWIRAGKRKQRRRRQHENSSSKKMARQVKACRDNERTEKPMVIPSSIINLTHQKHLAPSWMQHENESVATRQRDQRFPSRYADLPIQTNTKYKQKKLTSTNHQEQKEREEHGRHTVPSQFPSCVQNCRQTSRKGHATEPPHSTFLSGKRDQRRRMRTRIFIFTLSFIASHRCVTSHTRGRRERWGCCRVL